MTFREAVESCAPIRTFYRSGLRAMGDRRACVSCDNTRSLTGSVDLDHALRRLYPESPRWDYGIGFRPASQSEVAVWVEIHPASSTHVEDVLSKLRWLRAWLAREAPALMAITKGGFYWIAPAGPIAITADSPQAKRLAANGLKGPRRSLELRAAASA